jgi:hypothetical protein
LVSSLTDNKGCHGHLFSGKFFNFLGEEAWLNFDCFQATIGLELSPGMLALIQSLAQKIDFHPHIHLLVTDGIEDL